MTSFVGLRVLYDALLLCVHLNGSVQTQLDTPPVALVAVSPTWNGAGSTMFDTDITLRLTLYPRSTSRERTPSR